MKTHTDSAVRTPTYAGGYRHTYARRSDLSRVWLHRSLLAGSSLTELLLSAIVPLLRLTVTAQCHRRDMRRV